MEGRGNSICSTHGWVSVDKVWWQSGSGGLTLESTMVSQLRENKMNESGLNHDSEGL